MDALTGLPTKAELQETFFGERVSPTRPILAIFVDIAGLIWFNDAYGHREGDAAIVTMARWLAEIATQHEGLAFRVGGDEFLLVLPNAEHAAARALALRLIAESSALGIPYPDKAGGPRNLKVNTVLTRVTPLALHQLHAFREEMADLTYRAQRAAGTRYGVFAESGA
jgi:diguanylate cyclase (GGDEF)-like protein